METLTYRLKKEGKPHVIVAVVRYGKNQYVSYSRCSVNDQFDRKIGRAIALGRAEALAQVYENGAPQRRGIVGKSRKVPYPSDIVIEFVCGDPTEVIEVPPWMLTPRPVKNESL